MKRAGDFSRELIGDGVIDLCKSADVCFLALHGGAGEDGHVEALLDCFGIAYTGSPMAACHAAMDKQISKLICREAGITVPIAPSSGLMFAVSTSDSFDPLYDDLKIYGAFVMIQTYTYETREDEYGRTRIKTIPLVVPLRDYQKKTFRVIE